MQPSWDQSMPTTNAMTSPTSSNNRAGTTGNGFVRWWRDIGASHNAYVAERQQRRKRKLELMPITPFELWFYRLTFSALGLVHAWLLMGGLS